LASTLSPDNLPAELQPLFRLFFSHLLMRGDPSGVNWHSAFNELVAASLEPDTAKTGQTILANLHAIDILLGPVIGARR